MKRSNVRWMTAACAAAMLGSGLVTAHGQEAGTNAAAEAGARIETAAPHSQTVETGNEHPLYFGAGIGFLDFDGGQPVRDGYFPVLHVGYDFTDKLSLDAQFRVLPNLRGQYRYDADTGAQINRLWEKTGGTNGGVNDTWGYGAAVDGLYHFTRWERLDPYLAVGIGYDWYQHSFYSPGYTLSLRLGGGVMYHLNDEWAIRLDFRGYPVGNQNKFNANSEYEAGVVWTWGAHTPAKFSVSGVGLAPVAPGSPPAAAAKEFTPGLPPPGDLQMFKLDLIVAEEGNWHPEYFSELDAIAKAIQSHPGSDVWIEGHTDRKPTISDRDARTLTGKQAEAVRDYFVKNHGIARKRLTAAGYGFSRPKAPNDPVNGNPENRRMEIHIRPPQKAP